MGAALNTDPGLSHADLDRELCGGDGRTYQHKRSLATNAPALPLVSVHVNDVQLSALAKLLHGQPIDTGERCELLTLHIHLHRQTQQYRADVARLLKDMGADALVRS